MQSMWPGGLSGCTAFQLFCCETTMKKRWAMGDTARKAFLYSAIFVNKSGAICKLLLCVTVMRFLKLQATRFAR